MKRHSKSYWSWVTYILIILLLIPAQVSAQQPAAPQAPIEPKVLQQIASQGSATFWVVLKDQADLSPAYKIQDWNARGEFVYNRLNAVANQTQAGLRADLQKRGVSFKPFWIINTIQVTAGQGVLNDLASQPEVAQILASRTYQIPEPKPGTNEPTVNTVEWNIDRINAPQVWSTYGDRGEGIVVASIDTGVQFDHPALVNQYRGNMGGGVFDHNYNWFDPSNVCGTPSLAPCDNVDHGTHTMGTMVGDDGDPGTNQIGVAPHAKWIAAKGCETNSCSDFALLASGQWVLAPTDLNGNNPRPDLRPNIVNNSWGGGPGDPFYQATVQAWVASGIFPAFSAGNAGPACNTAGSPGDYPESYAAGAFDINNAIASFSSRGPSAFGGTKPNVAAPGVNVRSSIPGNSYASFSGTSMASPHVAGTVALIWSAAPTLIGDIAGTRAILDQTAIDTSDLSCGGTDGNNNVWGEGRLDAYAAVTAAPRGPTGTLQGTVTDSTTGSPLAGVLIHAVGPVTRDVVTDASGTYSLILSAGTYDVTASVFGYLSQTANGVVITDGGTTTQDFALDPAPSYTLSGHVYDSSGSPIANATVTILNTSIPPATTDASGAYSFASVPQGSYDVDAAAGNCSLHQVQSINLAGDLTLDFNLQQRSDSFGYFCRIETPAYVDATDPLPLSGDDSYISVSLPFAFTFYGQTYNTAYMCTNGYLNFLAGNCYYSNSGIPSAGAPNAGIYPFWDDLYMDSSSSAWSEVIGTSPDQSFIMEWRNVRFFGDTTRRLDFEVILHENGQIQTEYRNIANDGREQGNSATVGIENATGDVALQYSFNEAAIGSPDFAVLYRLPPSAFVEGHVTDVNDGQPVAGANVEALLNGSTVRQTSTDADGFYRMQLPLDTYTIQASATNYSTESATVVMDTEDQTYTQDFALKTARMEVNPSSLQFIETPDKTHTQTLVLSNTGTLPANWQIHETGGSKVATSSTAGLQKNPDYDPNARTTQGLYTVATPPGWGPSAPGDVIRSWSTGLTLGWGVGYQGNVWLSDVQTGACGSGCIDHEFDTYGTPTGRSWPTPWAGSWPGDMAYDAGRGIMCQVNVGGDNGIYCFDPTTGEVAASITGSFPWTGISQRGLAYRPDDDSFYIGGWNEGILYHIQGLSGANPGEVISQCNPPDGNISGLAWNPAANIVWEATNSPTDTIYELNPDTCAVLNTLPHPNPGYNGAGLAMDEAGNLWMIGQSPNTAYLVDSGVPSFTDVPWLSETPDSGTLDPGAAQNISVTVDTTGLTPGVYMATLFLNSNSGRQPVISIPVTLVVPAYQAGVNAGGDAYTDSYGDTWMADQGYTSGSWGYMNSHSRPGSTRTTIGGTNDSPMYQAYRQDPTEYRFDGLPAGIYEIELHFAEPTNRQPGSRVFDVIAEGHMMIPSLDIAYDVGDYWADDYTYFIPVTDGELNLRFVGNRGYAPPIVNAIRVTDRPDK